MGSSLTRMVRRSVRAGQNMISQVVVSVAAAVCVGLITNAYFEQKSASPEPAAMQATEQAAVDLVAKAPIRIIQEAIIETAETGQPPRPLQPAAEALVRNATEALPVIPGAAGETGETSLPPLPSQMIADLPVRDVTAMPKGAEIFPGVPAEGTLVELLRNPLPVAEQQPEHRRFLGLPLPYFVPTASDLVQSASEVGGKIAAIVDIR